MDTFKLRELVRVGDAIELIAEVTGSTIPEVVYALEEEVLSGMQANQIEEYHSNERDV